MMYWTFALYTGLAMLGWNEHTVSIEEKPRRVWTHTSGLVLYRE